MKAINKIDAIPLAQGIQQILFDILKKHGKAIYPIHEFERLIMESKGVSKQEAHRVTQAVAQTGIVRVLLGQNCFTL